MPPFMQGAEYLNQDFLEHQWERLLEHFRLEIKTYRGSVEEYFVGLNPDRHLAGRVYFHLVENKHDTEFPFAFMATYLASVKEQEDPTHRPLRYALEEYKNDEKKMLHLLATIRRASSNSQLVKKLLDSGEIFEALRWSSSEAEAFLRETKIYSEAGILCRIPNWWRAGSRGPKLNFVVGEKKSSLFGADSLVDFDVKIAIGETKLSEKEIEDLLKQSEGLAFLKGKWVKVDKDNLKSALDKWQLAKKLVKEQGISFFEAMRLLSGRSESFEELGLDDIEITQGKWLEGLMAKLKNPELSRDQNPSKKFKGELRPYQHEGFRWLGTLDSLRLGGCLADDMGLGKTIQVLAFVQKLAAKKAAKPNLLVLPTSLLSNWVEEIEKFAPSIKYLVAHNSSEAFTKLEKINGETLSKYDLVMTTYGLVRKSEWAQKISWNYVILDEAQAIKNPNSAQTKSIKLLKSSNRLALTGTPVENHVGDLWSIFDFINPGLLGTKSEFQDLSKRLSQNGKGLAPIRQVISPYILRRLKTDKSIISDLPAKIELKSYCELSKKQAAQYRRLVSFVEEALEDSTGIKRKGLILSSLMKFKQICNHPDQYLGTGAFSEQGSGKLVRLREICETVREKREKLLIFTQFKEMIPPLEKFLTELFSRKGVTLHGGTSVKRRKEAVENFQNDSTYTPFFILSLKAGGTGLNLTAANHVVHFDRWWNPAVENQATDRAFRIGQQKKVVVHKLISKGTLEEKIDQMIEEKSKLFNSLISGKNEIKFSEMSNREIIDLVKMDRRL